MAHYNHGIQLQPTSVDALVNRSSLLMELARPADALKGYNQALGLSPTSLDAQWGKSLALLALGQYAEGWPLYETGFKRPNTRGVVPFQSLAWDGRTFTGKRLLIWGEQGFGDVLQFIRYGALCKERGGTLLVMCRKPLMRLLKNCPFIDDVLETATESDFDYHVPVMSLPNIFGTTLDTIPASIPYLFVSDEARQKWAPRFTTVKKMKVGLVWSGNPRQNQLEAHLVDRRRSMSLELLKPLLRFEHISFYSLQMGEAAEQIKLSEWQNQLINYMPEVDDFMDAAAIIENLDLVISVDTSTAHLAGGLGKAVWVLSRFDGCWRWLQNQEQSPWYPTAHIFGQPTQGNWESVVKKIEQELMVRQEAQS